MPKRIQTAHLGRSFLSTLRHVFVCLLSIVYIMDTLCRFAENPARRLT